MLHFVFCLIWIQQRRGDTEIISEPDQILPTSRRTGVGVVKRKPRSDSSVQGLAALMAFREELGRGKGQGTTGVGKQWGRTLTLRDYEVARS